MRFWSFLALTVLAAGLACDEPGAPPTVTGTLEVAVSGLPDTTDADITVTGPGGFSRPITKTQAITGLEPGTYTIAVERVSTDLATFEPAFGSFTVTVSGRSVSQAAVIYAVVTGAIRVTVTGAPPDAPGSVVITGPSGFRDTLTASSTLGRLAPGTYTLTPIETSRGSEIWVPKPAILVVTVTPSVTPVAATISYALTTGIMAVYVNGLPVGVAAAITVTGPGGYTRTVTASVVLEGLREGRYDLVAAPVTGGGGHTPSPVAQSVTVVPGATGQASVNYWPDTPPPGLNLAIDAVHMQQVVQTYGGAVPAIAGREGLLRVYVRASAPNTVSPLVRVRLYVGTQLVSTVPVPATSPGVPTAIDQSALAKSWNATIPAALMQPGLRIMVDVDPDNLVPESAEDDNAWPSSGTPLALDVRAVPPLAIRLVPITQSANGLTGHVTPDIARQYEAEARRLLPVGALTVDVREPFVTSAPAIQPNDANGAWVQILSELNALRALEATTAHYYGVIKAPYTSGVIGISFLPSVVAVGWDSLPNATSNMVHELGHNFGRVHSPSCGARGPDANYPYADGSIGVYGFDQSTGTVISPQARDIMGYCDGRWISDYTYMGILAFRASQPSVIALDNRGAARPGLLVWGRIGLDSVVLEPVFAVTAPPKLPLAGGPHQLDLLDERGDRLVSLSFAGERTSHAPDKSEHFAFVVPLDALGGRDLAEVRFHSAQRRGVTRSTGASAHAPAGSGVVATRLSSTQVRMHGTGSGARGVLVRDAATGAIVTISRGEPGTLTTRATMLDVTVSDGIRNHRQTVVVR